MAIPQNTAAALDAGSSLIGIPVLGTIVNKISNLVSGTPTLNGPLINPIAWSFTNDTVTALKGITGSLWTQFDALFPANLAARASQNWSSQLGQRQYQLAIYRMTGQTYAADTEGYTAFDKPPGQRSGWAMWAAYQAVLSGVKMDSRQSGEVAQRILLLGQNVFGPAIQDTLNALGITFDVNTQSWGQPKASTPGGTNVTTTPAAPVQAGFFGSTSSMLVIAAVAVIALGLILSKGK